MFSVYRPFQRLHFHLGENKRLFLGLTGFHKNTPSLPIWQEFPPSNQLDILDLEYFHPRIRDGVGPTGG